jgi:hypothetical protein
MAAFLTNMASTTRLEIGIQFFPLGTAPCQADYATPEVELMPLATGAAVINAAIAAHSPSGLAATGPALESAIAHMKAVAPTHPNEVLSVSLVTESRPADCQPSAIADLATIAASGMAADPRVRTFVIALGEASTLFDPVARAGGTSASIVVPSDNISSGVNDALSKVFFPQEYCAYDIASLVPPGATLDPNLVSVSFPRGLPDGGTIEAPLIQNPSDCASAAIQRNGWSVHPFVADTIVLCGWSCMHFSADVRIAYGCR